MAEDSNKSEKISTAFSNRNTENTLDGLQICDVNNNPAFDMTPPELIAGIITEKGVIYPPFESNLKPLFESDK